MKKRTVRRVGALAGATGVAAAAAVGAVAAAGTITGPSSSQSPYLTPSEPGVVTKSILTVGDSVNDTPDGTKYRMVGIPDGLGAFDNHDGTFTVLMNQELDGAGVGVERAHGAKGAFVSKWTIDKKTLRVRKGEDLIQRVALWNPAANSYDAPTSGVVFTRFCSADLPARSAFYDDGRGFSGRLFMNGEESGTEGRAFAHGLDGTSWELASLGKAAWENQVAQPDSGTNTVVVGLDDGPGGQVYVYVGAKRRSGSPVEKAGLVGGRLYGVKIDGRPLEDAATGIPSGTRFSLEPLGDVSAKSGAQLNTDSIAAEVTTFQRPEDGAWDPENNRRFYFNTTASFTGNSRLWRLNFSDPEKPTKGGTIDMLLDGSEGQKMLDNLTVSDHGQVILQEDPGNNPYVAKVYRYSVKRDTLTEVARHDEARFAPGAPLGVDEESSAVIPVDEILGKGWYLLTQQAHSDPGATDPELVEGGQLLAMRVPPGRGR